MSTNGSQPDPPLQQKMTTAFNFIAICALTLEVFFRYKFSARYIRNHLAVLLFSILAGGGVGLLGLIFFAGALEKAVKVSRLPQFLLMSFFLMVVHIAVGVVLKLIRRIRYGADLPHRPEYLSEYWGSSWLSLLLRYVRLSPRIVQLYVEPLAALALGFLISSIDQGLGGWVVMAAVCLFFKEKYYDSQGEDINDQRQDQRILTGMRNPGIQGGSQSAAQQPPASVRVRRRRDRN